MITIDVNTREVEQALRTMGAQTPKAVARAINDTAFKVMAAERDEIRRAFNQPTAWVARNVQVSKATPEGGPDKRTGQTLSPLTALVGPSDYGNRGGKQQGGSGWERVIAPHVYGGSRLQKASEARLQQAGLLPRGWFTVPGQGAKMDRNGNISGGEIVALLSWVGAMGQYAGDNANKSKRETRRRNAAERRNEAYFVARVGNRQRLQPGIYKRFGNTRKIMPLLIFVSSVDYARILDWEGVGERTAAAEFPRAFAAAFDAIR